MTTAERSRQLGVATVVVAAGAEVVTALVLIIRPALFGWLLFGTEFSPSGLALGRLAGFALLALALACWPGSGTEIGDRSTGHLQPAQRDLSRLSWGHRWAGGAASVASGCYACGSNNHPHSRLVQDFSAGRGDS
jgi:hypothetical protein